VALGTDASVRLIHNGTEILRGRSTLLTTINASGVYRIESTKTKTPWLMTNPIYITR
jgi:hypothetical protein